MLTDQQDEGNIANAKLIAAAPDMLDALKEMHVALLLALGHAHPRNSGSLNLICARARRAIEQATDKC